VNRNFCWSASVLALLASGTGIAASFPCEKAQSKVELLICKESELSTLDEHLAQYYSGATEALGDGAACLKDNQRSWLRLVRNKCADAACLKQAYLLRLAELDGLQPGATAIRYFELPKAPALVWVIPPEKDTTSAPPQKGLPPLNVSGKLVNELAQGDGFVIQAADGKKHVLLLSMFAEGANLERLEMLSKESAQFSVRGSAETGSDATPHFAPSRCSFIYRR
jgi:uncharacterized protein